ncbi:hypothetical protein CW731_01510 [Polaribacter sp. ALD11]|uniref:hypothetical protein n=1 Tax=Polaribacter sp. ALD11 TaxID=2058137 RepID=UPI000C301A4B|nr:hypothetical protein [Polaribacter sp. ALD11]AUC84048.1 hypothetical protein CW731_01510 [Polaribacter sp. ALD11]
MKNLKTIIAVIAISLSTVFSISATEVNPKKTKTLRTEMSSFIGNNIPVQLNKTTTAEVTFIINNKNEIVVLSVNSKVSELNSFLKRKLNYKIITVKGIKKGEIYKMPLKINVK